MEYPLEFAKSLTVVVGFLRLFVSLVCLSISVLSFKRKRELQIFNQLSFFSFFMFAWDFLVGAYFLVSEISFLPILNSLIYVFVPLTALTFFFFGYCHYHEVFRMKTSFVLSFSIIPIITILLSVTTPLGIHNFFQDYGTGIVYKPTRELELTYGVWFYIHSAYSYLLILTGSGLLLIKALKPKTRNKKIYQIMASVATLYCFYNIAGTFFLPTNRVGIFTPLLHLLLVNSFFWSSFLDKEGTLEYLGKRDYFDNLSTPLFIFNKNQELISINSSANRFILDMNKTFEQYMSVENLFGKDSFNSLGIPYEENGLICYYIQHKISNQIFYCQKAEVHSSRGAVLGFSLTINNMKTLDTLIHNLEEHAYIDSLCKCGNRTLFDQKKHELLNNGSRPSALIIADLDGLKVVNDIYGHRDGDDYIRKSCQILKKVTRSSDNIFRIGGDEFLILVNNTNKAGIDRIIKEIKAECDTQKAEYNFNISLGVSLVIEEEANFDKHFEIADYNMYQNKVANKALIANKTIEN
jgi:diguanylate cyclase (GGDEF)-like protein